MHVAIFGKEYILYIILNLFIRLYSSKAEGLQDTIGPTACSKMLTEKQV